MKRSRAHVFVQGRVQGVFFRASVRHRAQQLGVGGWVRNLPDGRVEAIFEGEEPAVQRAVEYTREGPVFARVTEVEVYDEPYQGEFEGFGLR